MAIKKNNEPQVTPEVDTQDTPQATSKEETPKSKVYKFVSSNKFLTCSALGVQFINGKAETESLEVAKVLATLNGVTLVED